MQDLPTLAPCLWALLSLLAGCSSPAHTKVEPGQEAMLALDPHDTEQGPSPSQDADTADSGPKLWREHCMVCHGAAGRGDGPAASALQPPPADLHPGLQQGSLTASSFGVRVRKGAPGTAMMSHEDRLDAGELGALHAWLLAEQKR